MRTHTRYIKREETDSYLMKRIKKENLPEKICTVCNKPFSWRRKWEKVWDKVKY